LGGLRVGEAEVGVGEEFEEKLKEGYNGKIERSTI
jgi:hypothetical protein